MSDEAIKVAVTEEKTTEPKPDAPSTSPSFWQFSMTPWVLVTTTILLREVW